MTLSIGLGLPGNQSETGYTCVVFNGSQLAGCCRMIKLALNSAFRSLASNCSPKKPNRLSFLSVGSLGSHRSAGVVQASKHCHRWES